MIHAHTNETQTRWDRGGYRVQLNLPNRPQAIGFCDGTDRDASELRARAEEEGAEHFRIERKLLKSGREIWTLHSDTDTSVVDA